MFICSVYTKGIINTSLRYEVKEESRYTVRDLTEQLVYVLPLWPTRPSSYLFVFLYDLSCFFSTHIYLNIFTALLSPDSNDKRARVSSEMDVLVSYVNYSYSSIGPCQWGTVTQVQVFPLLFFFLYLRKVLFNQVVKSIRFIRALKIEIYSSIVSSGG